MSMPTMFEIYFPETKTVMNNYFLNFIPFTLPNVVKKLISSIKIHYFKIRSDQQVRLIGSRIN